MNAKISQQRIPFESLEGRMFLSASLLADANSTPASSNPNSFMQFGDRVVFDATTSAGQTAMWISDGTAAGTQIIANTTMLPEHEQIVGNTLYFVGGDKTDGQQIWKTDGTPQGTQKLTDLDVSSDGSITELNQYVLTAGPHGLLLFTTGVSGTGNLWRSDGTIAGTFEISTVTPTSGAGLAFGAALKNEFYYGANSTQLWETDGTQQGTQELFAMPSDMVSADSPIGVGNIVNFNNELYIQGSGGNDGALYKSNGTLSGTKLLTVISNAGLHSFTQFDGGLYFTVFPQNSTTTELWKTDGTSVGTQQFDQGHLDGYIGNIGNKALFLTSQSITSTGEQLWASDGNAHDTALVKEVDDLTGNTVILNGELYFETHDKSGSKLWQSDGTTAGTKVVSNLNIPLYFPAVGGRVGNQLLLVGDDRTHGIEPWAFDPATGQSTSLLDLPGTENSDPTPVAQIGNFLFFTAKVGQENWLWRTDGTAAGTINLGAEMEPGDRLLEFDGLLMVGSIRTDGTPQGTANIFSNPAEFPNAATAVGNGKFYISTEGSLAGGGTSAEIFELDSPFAAPKLIWSSSLSGSNVAFNDGPVLLSQNGTVYFNYQNYRLNDRAWYVINPDDTVSNLGATWPGPGSVPTVSTPMPLGSDSIMIGQTQYFAFNDGTSGDELWMNDGSGQQLVEDLNPGPASSSPDQLIEVNGQLIFAATTPDVGRELYAIQIDPPAPTSPLVPTSTAGDTTSGGNGSEPLAPLPTVNVTTLRISGTSNDDSIRVFLRASNNKMLEVDDDGVISAYRARDISLIQIDAGDGNDTIKFDESNGAITIASKLYGDAGDDSITGGSGADRILGGDGNDWIEGSGGNDIIYGEAGNDRLFGGDGKDHIDGGAGTNVIRGEGGLDTIVASIGDDIRGNKGDVLDILGA